MRKNLYYRHVYERRVLILDMLLDFFLSLSSMPRLLMEVFIRRNMGERYFSSLIAGFLLIILAFIPYSLPGVFSSYGFDSIIDAIINNPSWYLFLAAFAYASIQRWLEIRRLPSVFDFERFSLSAGIIHRGFYAIRINGKPVDQRTIEIYLEPALFFAIGLVVLLMGMPVGMLLIISSILYSLSYVAAYKRGDDFIMDIIDKKICGDEFEKSFVDGLEASETRGFHFYGRRPTDPGTRRDIADIILDDDDIAEAR